MYVSAQLRAIDQEYWHRAGEEAQAGTEARSGSRGLRGGRRSAHRLLRGGAARRLLTHSREQAELPTDGGRRGRRRLLQRLQSWPARSVGTLSGALLARAGRTERSTELK